MFYGRTEATNNSEIQNRIIALVNVQRRAEILVAEEAATETTVSDR